MKKPFKIIIACIIFLILLMPIALYVYIFRDFEISKNPSDWSDFGGYVGGVYSVLLTVFVVYLSRQLYKRDEIQSKRKKAVEEIYLQIAKIKIKKINIQHVNKIYSIALMNKLYITDETYNKVINLADHYLEVAGESCSLNTVLDTAVKNHLKSIYDA